MKKIVILSLVVFALTFYSSSLKAQFNPYADNVKLLSAGIGASGWGVPIYGRIVFPVADNITVGGGLSYQSYGYSNNWNLSIFGIGARGNYHFNELLEIDDEWDFYGGLGLTYYILNSSYDGANSGFFDYSGGGPDGIGLGIHVGGRYFVSDNIGINVELGGGSALSGALLGVTFVL